MCQARAGQQQDSYQVRQYVQSNYIFFQLEIKTSVIVNKEKARVERGNSSVGSGSREVRGNNKYWGRSHNDT